jgi:hypothetical protein
MMAGPNRTLKLSYVGDASSLTKANEEAESGLSKLGDRFKKFGKIAAVGAAAAAAGLVAFAKKSVDAAAEAEAAQSRLATILTNTGLATEGQITALNNQAAALEKVGVASAGNITTLQAQLATFDLTADTIATLTPAITDYVIAEKGAAAGAADFQSAANGLAQALQGNFASLTRTGFVLDDTTKELITNGTEAERAAALVEVLGSTYAGFNEKARETTEGQLVALKNGFGALQEQIGGLLLPVVNDLVGGVQRLIDRVQDFWEVHGPAIVERLTEFRERALELWAQLKERLAPIVIELKDQVVVLWGQFQELLTRFREWWERVGPGVIDSFRRLKDPIVELWSNIKVAFDQIGQLIGAFRRGESDGQGFQRFIDGLVTLIGLLVKGLNLAVVVMNKFRDILLRIVESKAFQALLSGIGSIGSALGSGLGKLGGIVGLASGGIVTKPTLAMVGEGGEPEAVIPLSKMGQMGGGTVINVQVGVGDPEAIARSIERILDDSRRRTGTLVAA